jgi:AcrR family transcriptional regulator
MKKLGVKERIIEAASHLFYFEGYNQTGINKILKEANVSKDSMYRYFRSKEDIAVAYLEGRHYMWMGNLIDSVKSKQTTKEKVIGSFDYLYTWLKDVDYRGCGWQNIITDLPQDHDKIRQQAVLHKNELRAWIHEQLQQEAQFNSEDVTTVGDQILILIEGAIILSQIQKDSWPIESAKQACIKILN